MNIWSKQGSYNVRLTEASKSWSIGQGDHNTIVFLSGYVGKGKPHHDAGNLNYPV